MGIDRDRRLEYYTLLARTRELVLALKENRSEIQGPLLTPHGHEAVGLGVALGFREAGLLEESVLYGDHRTLHGIAVAKDSVLPEGTHNHLLQILANHFLRTDAPNRGRDGNIHWGCFEHGIGPFALSHMGAMAPAAVGHAMALQKKGLRGIGATFFGEGAAQQGAVHEAMNFAVAMEEAAEKAVPVLFVINANQFSISAGPGEEHGNSNLSARAQGYGRMQGFDVDGDDLEATVAMARDIAEMVYQNQYPALLVCHTDRRTGHNEDENQTVYRVQEDIDEAWKTEPLLRYHLFLSDIDMDEGGVEEAELLAICEKENEQARTVTRDILARPPLDLAWHQKTDQSLFIPHTDPAIIPGDDAIWKNMRYGQALNHALGLILDKDPLARFFGQDIATKGGVMEVTRGLVEQFGKERVFNTPISEEAIVGAMVGLALGDEHPISEIQFAPFFAEAMAQYLYVIAPNWYQKQMGMGFAQIYHFGVVGDGGSGHYHSEPVERYLYPAQGIKIVFPADAYEMAGLLYAAHLDPNPVIVCSQIYAYGQSEFLSKVPNQPFTLPIGKAAVAREGTDLSVLVYGAAAVRAALNESEELAREGISCEVVNLRSVVPLDMETIASSIQKTQRFVVMHEDRGEGGVGMSIVGKIALDPATHPYVRTNPAGHLVAAENVPIPTAKELEWARLPFEQFMLESGQIILRSSKLKGAARDLMRY